MTNVINVNLGAKNLDSQLEYVPFKKVSTITEEPSFLVENVVREVTEATEGHKVKKVRKLKKLVKVSLSVLAASINIAPRAMASGVTGGTPLLSPLTPAVVMEWGLQLAFIAVAAGVAVAMVTLTTAGVYRMLRKKQEADAWSQDILKGLTQVLISVPSIYLLYYLAKLLFQNLNFLKLAL
ncbi:hypothetical protein [Bacillus phage CM1]|nr:hypothetical protein [Bacillus phage CM1]